MSFNLPLLCSCTLHSKALFACLSAYCKVEQRPICMHAGILGGECAAALAGGINIMLWHDVTAGICALQVLLILVGILSRLL